MALTMSAEQIAMGHFLWSNFTRPISAADVLRASGLARAQAHACFHEAHGEPPKRALTRCRLALAERLSAEGLQDAEIAARSGFASAACLRRVRKAWRA
ncbi:MAG: helix-turn-helix transcriptional regulator [Planctomycetes bacterium]|nr:helix-turn-helix transcriptional regulator [Planctomycetota bacterium]